MENSENTMCIIDNGDKITICNKENVQEVIVSQYRNEWNVTAYDFGGMPAKEAIRYSRLILEAGKIANSKNLGTKYSPPADFNYIHKEI